jgi:4-amino-4-deoxy-L-arabinose transferase-like glycosyltransferase
MRKREIVFLILILILQLALRIPFLQEPLEGDEGAYAYIAQGLQRGELPYRDTFDHKPPALYFIYAAIFKFFGNSLAALRYFTAGYSLLTTLAVFSVASIIMGGAGGLVAALFYAIFSNGPYLEGTSSNAEVFMVLPIVLAFGLFRLAQKRKSAFNYFLAGLLAGVATMIKQVAFFNFAALLAAMFFDKQSEDKLKNGCLLLLGFLLPLLGFSLYFAYRGAFSEFLDNAFLINFSYLRPFVGALNPQWGALNLYRIAYLLIEEAPLFILAAGGIIYLSLPAGRNLLMVFWALSSALGVLVGRYLFGHYFIQLLPPLTILSGYAVIQWHKSDWGLKTRFLFLALFVIWAGVAGANFYKFYLVYTPDEIAYARYHIDNLTLARQTARIISARSFPADKVLVWGSDPQIYFYSQRRCPGKYIYLPFHFPDRFAQACREAEKIIEEKKVKFVVLTRPVHHLLYEKIDKNFRLIFFRNARFHNEIIPWGVFEVI